MEVRSQVDPHPTGCIILKVGSSMFPSALYVQSDWMPSSHIALPPPEGHNRELPTQARSSPSSPPQPVNSSEYWAKHIKMTRTYVLFDDPRVMYEDPLATRHVHLISFDRSPERTITTHYRTTPQADKASPTRIYRSLGSSSDTLSDACTILVEVRTPCRGP